jgi:Heterokaryon incompatibility protein (HET)
VSIGTNINNAPQLPIMSDSEPDSPQAFGPNSRRRTWATGDGSVPQPARTIAKNKLRRIVLDEIVVYESGYKYQELASSDEIRVLRILKGKPGDKIECSLIPSALASSKKTPSTSTAATLKYQALSYWWGNGQPNKEIIIHSYGRHKTGSDKAKGMFERDTFYIRPNLEAALQQIRSQENDVDIWVDAICINQEDKKEKTAQVSMMHEIYAEAEKVCIWLGAGNPEIPAATFKFLKEILNLQRLDELIKTRADAEKWMLIVELMENRWFSRRWVIQELTLAKSAIVRWGKERLPWPHFADAIALFMTKHDEIREILKETKYAHAFGDPHALGTNTLVNASNNLFRKSEDGKIQQRLITLEMLVSCHFLAFEATNPRDTIFAVLSIAKDTSYAMNDLKARTSWELKSLKKPPNGLYSSFKDALFRWLFPEPMSPVVEAADDPRITPDYDKCLVDVCADFMDYCIEKSQSLDIICRHWAPLPQEQTEREKLRPSAIPEEVEILPTWIPSIRGHAFGTPEDALQGRSNGDSFVGTMERPNQQHYNSSAKLPAWVEFGKYDHTEKITVPDEGEVPTGAMIEPLKGGTPKAIETSSRRPKKFDGTMRIKGFRLGRIENLTGRISQGMIQHEAFQMCGLELDSRSQMNPVKKVPDQLWRTLVADRGPNGINAPSWYHRACLESLKEVDSNGDLNTRALKEDKGTASTIVSFLERVQRVVWNRKFFQSEAKGDGKPLFGIAPHNAKFKDIICIIFGCSVPVLLRECITPDETYFELVGECYVYGYMDGEAIPQKNRPKYPYDEAVTFSLR